MTTDPVIEPVELIKDRLWRLGLSGRKRQNHRAVVFVHGFAGDAQSTWKADETDSFPNLVASDPRLEDYDVFLYQYKTGFSLPSAIENIVKHFAFALNRHLPSYSIVFVAHSMGGLVCMRYALSQLESAAPLRVAGLLTYGTPMSGVEWIRYANSILLLAGIKLPVISWVYKFFRTNRQLEDMRAGGEFIDRLNSQWILHVLNGGYPTIPANLRTWLPTRVVTGNEDWVVSESSARGFYGDVDWVPVDRGHIKLVKPIGRSDDTYQIASDFITECRSWIGPASALKLRQQADMIWKLHRGRRISDWTLDLSFAGRQASGDQEFGLPGFDEFTVRECSYTRFFDEHSLKFGFAFGGIASRKIWNNQFVFLHKILLRGLPREISRTISDNLRGLLRDPSHAWKTLFHDLRIAIGSGANAVKLTVESPEVVDDGIVAGIHLPKQFIGTEARVTIAFRTLLPCDIKQYRIWFPWLCETFSATVSFERGVEYVAAYQAMRGSIEADIEEETFGKMRFHSQALILPESYIQFEWAFNKNIETLVSAASGTSS